VAAGAAGAGAGAGVGAGALIAAVSSLSLGGWAPDTQNGEQEGDQGQAGGNGNATEAAGGAVSGVLSFR
jgi:hypothetical protein